MTARIWNPAIEAEGGDGFAEVPDSAVPQLRQSGWLLASERDEHLDRLAAHPSQAKQAAEAAGDQAAEDTGPGKRRPRATAGTDAGPEGS